jgi:predicted GNAT family acetyltransferase
MPTHMLDRPVWGALSTRQADRATGNDLARRMAPEFGVFAAPIDTSPNSLAALAALAPARGELWLVEAEDFPLPETLLTLSQTVCRQMTLSHPTPPARPCHAETLTESDAPAMLALATLTRPGPFFARTHALGRFIGIKQSGELIAMAGERMQPTGFTEVSGVCTHPGHRGRGYAGALMRMVAAGILARGETPFLHVYASNTGAIGLYDSLGFTTRRHITMTVLQRPPH